MIPMLIVYLRGNLCTEGNYSASFLVLHQSKGTCPISSALFSANFIMKGELRWKLKLDSYFSICLYALSFIHNSWPQLKASDQQWKTLSTATSVQFRWHEPGLQYFQTAIKYLRYCLILIRVYGFKIRKKGNTKRPKVRNTSAAQNAPKCFM